MALKRLPTSGMEVAPDRLHAWVHALVTSLGTPPDIATDVADALLAADARGVSTHGTFKLPVYALVADSGVLDVRARPTRAGGTEVLSVWDAHDGWGQHSGRVLMDHAIERAATLGLAGAVARRASHFGIAGWYAMRAAERGAIGLVLTNTAPLVAPTRGRERLLGTNPIALAAPAADGRMYVLDMATSAITWGHVLTSARHDVPLPEGVAIDGQGRATSDPHAVLADGALLGLGGGEASGGHKGYGLALMVDILTGVLAGAAFGSGVVPQSSRATEPSDLGQLFLAIDPRALGDEGFGQRLASYLDELRASPVASDAAGPVLVHGDPEAENEAMQADGIRLSELDHRSLVTLGEQRGVPFPTASPFEAPT